MKEALQRSLPRLGNETTDIIYEFYGATYPTPPLRAALASLCRMGFIALLVLAMAGNRLPFIPPEINAWVQERRGMLIGGAFMLNMLGGSLAQTGAYEVYVDGKQVYSKLQTGTVPTAQLVQRLILEATLLQEA